MAVLRWLHRSWKLIWSIVFTVLLTVIVVAGVCLALLQLDLTQNYLTDRIESRIERDFKARLNIGEVGGFPPLNLTLQDVVLLHPDSTQTDTVAKIASIHNELDIWGLLQNKVSITGFELNRPEVWLRKGDNGRVTFLQRRKPSPDTTSGEPWLNDVEILAPSMDISEGTLHLLDVADNAGALNLPPSVTFTNINANMFLEWSEQQSFLDIESFSARTADLEMENFSMTGQVYSDRQQLEFNSFSFNFGRSEILVNGQVYGVDLGSQGFIDQFLAARYNLEVISPGLYPEEFSMIIPGVPDLKGPLVLNLITEGTTDELLVEEVAIGRGKSLFRLNGRFQNLRRPDAFSYQVSIDRLNLRKEDIPPMIDTLNTPKYKALEDLTLKGRAGGTLDSIGVNLSVSSPLGKLDVAGGSRLKRPYRYNGTFAAQNLDVSWLADAVLDTTSLNLRGRLSGQGVTLEGANNEFEAVFTDSRINQERFDQLQLNSTLSDGRWNQQYSYRNGDERITGSGQIDFSREQPPVTMQGKAQNINLVTLVGDTSIAETSLNFEYMVDAEGTDVDEIEGRAMIDVSPSVIGPDTVEAHQFYADINTTDNRRRALRFTSSLFDMEVEGPLYTDDIVQQTRYWSSYLKNRYRAEIAMDSTASLPGSIAQPSQNLVLDGSFTAKNLSLIKKYLPDFPSVYTDSRITFNVNSGANRLLLSADMQADTLQYNAWQAKDSRIQLTAGFRSDSTIKQFSSVDLTADMAVLRSNTVNMDSLGVALTLEQDSIYYRQQVGNIGENARFAFEANGTLTDSATVASIQEFYLGNENYAWTSQGNPVFRFTGPDRVAFEDFEFMNQDEFFQLQGAVSPSRDDSLSYSLRDINLTRISELVEGRIDFGGILNGNLVTRSLTRQPTIQGKLDVSRLKLNQRMVGDLSFQSNFNREKNRFDTRIAVRTDPQKYAEYLKTNDGVQQNFTLAGYFLTPNPDIQQDSLFYFDADFQKIDMWLIPLIVENIFQQMEGQATGNGFVSGNFEEIDFHADFNAQNVFAKPRFLNTNYFINGGVQVDRQEGVTLDSLAVMDTKGGSGTLWGNIDLNDFNPLTYLDLNFRMNELKILNTSMDPDVPFFGNISGTGTLRLSGSNTNMNLRSSNAIQVTNDSEISLPLMEETELNESGQFIRFVDSFENRGEIKNNDNGEKVDQNVREEQLRRQISNLTFSERFNLDLRFTTTDNIAVALIFDPVTGDMLNARGSGQMRIAMQGQELQMFGRYQIASGTYQFVTGEIISRKLDLQPGGTIVWEGPPDNARLDISAIYRARPNISTLTANSSVGDQNNGASQQVPINLIVDISGTLINVENDYYFRLPNSLDLSSNSTLSYTINQINRDEQQKLLQATSILFTGQFIPTQGAGGGTSSLSDNLTRSSTVVNPLLSNQVISPLLSNQINALLNSDVSRLDIDFNLNAYNEVDLGIALRLYNDRLILRREGQITGGGPQTDLGDRIGDLNATYRISRRLSLTAFHRQNQILSDFGTQSQGDDVTPSVDGLGLEANFQFNAWPELWNTIWNLSPKSPAKKEKENTKNTVSSKPLGNKDNF